MHLTPAVSCSAWQCEPRNHIYISRKKLQKRYAQVQMEPNRGLACCQRSVTSTDKTQLVLNITLPYNNTNTCI